MATEIQEFSYSKGKHFPFPFFSVFCFQCLLCSDIRTRPFHVNTCRRGRVFTWHFSCPGCGACTPTHSHRRVHTSGNGHRQSPLETLGRCFFVPGRDIHREHRQRSGLFALLSRPIKSFVYYLRILLLSIHQSVASFSDLPSKCVKYCVRYGIRVES